MEIEIFDPDTVIQGLLDGTEYINRVAATCVYRCPHCGHGVRFKWHHFLKADKRSFLRRIVRKAFDDYRPIIPSAERGFLDFHCPSCDAPARIIFLAKDYRLRAFHFDIETVLVGEREQST